MNFTLGNMNVHIFDSKLTFNAHEDEKTFMINRFEVWYLSMLVSFIENFA